MTTKDYFIRLAKFCSGFLSRVPLELEPQPLDYALGRLAPYLQEIKKRELDTLMALDKPQLNVETTPKIGVGLNSIGMLVDRFTILIIKEWCLRNKGVKDIERARDLYENQTLDIIEALAYSRPGNSALNSKITNIKSDASASSWDEAFYGLLVTNLVLWESQEILYIREIQQLPAEELRSYIKWFSYGNIKRNEFIQLCEEFYWNQGA